MLHSVKYKDPTRGTRHPCIWRGKHTKPRDPLPQSLCIQRLVCSQSWVGCDKVTMVFVYMLRFDFRHLEKQSKQSKKAILPTLMKPVRPVEVHTWQERSWQKEISNNQKNLPTNNNINERILWKPTTATKKDLAINNNTISTWPARWWNCSPHADQTHYSFSNTGLGLFLMIENFINRCWFCDLQTSSALPLSPERPMRAPVCVLATSLAILGAVRGTWISAWTRGGWERARSSLKSLIIQICCIIIIIISPIGRSAPL